MTRWVVTRHPGAMEWLRRRGFTNAHYVSHFDPGDVAAGDEVIGTLPVPLVAAVIERGACYYHLDVPLSAPMRGKELSADELERLGARLERYRAHRLTP